MNSKYNLEQRSHPLKSVLAMSLSAVMTALTCASTASFASDIEIYQEAKSGDISLMFMLDISNSMNEKDTGQTNSRWTLVKTAMTDLLQGNATKGITRISDDKIIGLSTLGYLQGTSDFKNTGAVRVPARRLDVMVGNKTQRQTLIDSINAITAYTNTPTARSFAETVAYMMGTNTNTTRSVANMPFYRQYTSGTSTTKQKCTKWNSSFTSCDTWSSTTDTIPTDWEELTSGACTFRHDSKDRSGTCYEYTGTYVAETVSNSGFQYSTSLAKNNALTAYIQPSSLQQNADEKKCSGQGIYVLTDGVPTQDSGSLPLLQNALGGSGTSFSCSNSTFDCVNKASLALLDPTKNPAGLKFKTAVVGFGAAFGNINSYDRAKTQQQNIDALGTINSDEKRAAYWGIIGEGGWYSGSSSQDVVNSVNNFINDLGADIPAVTTGTPTIPVDYLNPTVLQNKAYYPQFEPTPDKTYQLWAGNLKKYNVDINGMLRDKGNSLITNSQGRILDNYDLWSPAISTTPTDVERSEALVGGIKMKLDLRHLTNNTAKRKLLTTRDYTSSSREINGLRQVSIDDLDHTTRKLDPKVGYVMNLLGYRFDPTQYLSTGNTPQNTLTKTQLLAQPEFRQVGAVMHSSPVLLTNKGKITYDYMTKEVGSENREDYILFGTTQGVLHVVDAVTGQEKFAFVPNEMIESQAEALNRPEVTSGGIKKMFYGIDGPWTAYTEYVTDKNDPDTLTVGEGKSYTFTQGTDNVTRTQSGMQLVYGGLRMGGKSYYALDLANINSPSLKFKIQPSGTCSTSNPLGCMGQSWSKPTIGSVNWNGQKRLVMFIGGGYDAEGTNTGNANHKTTDKYRGYEYDDYVQSNKIGAGVYMFDALTGDLLWWAGANTTNNTTNPTYVPNAGASSSYDADMKYSVVSEIRTVDRNSDGLIDHLYFGDLGGQAWRIDLNNAAGTQKNIFARKPTRIMNLNAGAYSPRFYEMPAFSTYSLNGEIFAAVSFGSGNRSQPLVDYTVTATQYDYDAIFNLYDKDVANSQLLKMTGVGASKTFSMTDAQLKTKNVVLQAENVETVTASSINKLLSLTDSSRFTKTETRAPYDATQGWYYKFKSYKVQSEKVMSTPIVIGGDMFVTTFDGSKPGLSGDCGAGVKGESFMTLFCMPYGQCNSGSATTYRLNLGAGIVGGAVGAGDASGKQRLIVTNVDTTGLTDNAIVNRLYSPNDTLIPQRWYDRR